MKMNKIFLMILALALITVSCKKNEEETPTGPNPTQQWISAVSEKTFTFSGETLKFGKDGVPADGVVAIADPVQYTLEVVSSTQVIIGVKDEASKYVGYKLTAGAFLTRTAEGTKEKAKDFESNTEDGFDASSSKLTDLGNANWVFTAGTYISEAIPVENDATKKTFRYVKIGTAGQFVEGVGTGDAEYIFEGDDGDVLKAAAIAEIKTQATAKPFTPADIVVASSKYYAADEMFIIAFGTDEPYNFTQLYLSEVSDTKVSYNQETYTKAE